MPWQNRIKYISFKQKYNNNDKIEIADFLVKKEAKDKLNRGLLSIGQTRTRSWEAKP